MTGPVVRGAQLAPGDLLIVDGTAGASKLIEIGAVLDGDPAASHVAIYHHTDAHDYDSDPRTVTNAAQPKTPAQRTEICMYAVKLLGTGYDWIGGIAEDAALALHLPQLWTPDPASGQVPAHVVCSSLAAWVYDRAGLDAPGRGDWEHVTPGAWALFIGQRGWEHTA